MLIDRFSFSICYVKFDILSFIDTGTVVKLLDTFKRFNYYNNFGAND